MIQFDLTTQYFSIGWLNHQLVFRATGNSCYSFTSEFCTNRHSHSSKTYQTALHKSWLDHHLVEGTFFTWPPEPLFAWKKNTTTWGYRLRSEGHFWPAQMEDCELALQLMRQDAARGAFNATKCAGPVCFFHVGRWRWVEEAQFSC